MKAAEITRLAAVVGVPERQLRNSLIGLGIGVLVNEASRLQHREAQGRGLTPADLFRSSVEGRFVRAAYENLSED